MAQDTTAIVLDTIVTDTNAQLSLGVAVSKDSLEAEVVYNAEDSIKIDAIEKKIHLYGNAFVSYTDITLRAAHIELNWEKTIVEAEGMLNDTTGRMQGLPEFTDGTNTFTADRMRYNFETNKGIVYDAVSTQDDIQIHGARSKFIKAPANDTTAHDIIYSENATFTTCTADHPHFAIRSKKQKIVPGKRVIVGPSNLEIMDVPTPLWLPFGFFPISDGRSTGLLFPKDFEQSDRLGLGLKNVGWFFPLGERINLSVLGDVYLQGTYALGANVQYKKRYGYNGSFSLRYSSLKTESVVNVVDGNGNPVIVNGQIKQEAVFSRANGFTIDWAHRQEAAAHPLNTIGGNIHFETNNNSRQLNSDANVVNRSVIRSGFSFNRNWKDKPISMSVAFDHNQNVQTRKMTVNFPVFNFQTQTLYPFRQKERQGAKKWFEDITLRYTNEAKATFEGADTTFFERTTLDEARYGMRHRATTGTSFKILKYFNLNPNISYQEVWYGKRNVATFDPTQGLRIDTTILVNGEIQKDTVDYGTYVIDPQTGFYAFRTVNAGVSLNTQIFGTLRMKKGPIRGLRHVIKPSATMGFEPNYRDNENYYDYLRDTTSATGFDYYSRYRGGIYGTPPEADRKMSLSYSINNIIEAKLFSKKDSTERNIKLFDNIYVNGNYNFAADSLKWSPVTIRGTTRLLKGASTFTFNSTFDPLVRIQTGTSSFKRIDKTTWSENKKLIEFVDARFNLNTNFTIAKIRALFQGKEEEVVEQVDRNGNDLRPEDETDFLSLFENFSIRHNIAFSYEPLTVDKDTFKTTTHSIELRGSLAMTPNWNVDIGSIGYDFVRKSTTYPYLGLRRDLHCWEMGFHWAPTRNTYSFYLRVKPGTLDFLKVPYQRNNLDGPDPFR